MCYAYNDFTYIKNQSKGERNDDSYHHYCKHGPRLRQSELRRFLQTAPGGKSNPRLDHEKHDEQAGLLINIEAQNDFYPGYPLTKRAVYYCSRMISSQYGTVFTNSHYEKIQKVYSLWICVNPPKSRENTITGYHISEAGIVGDVREKPENYDLASIVMICLGNQGSAGRSSLLQLLDVLLSNDLDSAVKKKILSDDFGIPMTQPFTRRIDEMCNLSEGVLQKGIEQGIQQGLQLSLKNLMDTLHLTAEQAMDALKIAAADREKYASLISSDR